MTYAEIRELADQNSVGVDESIDGRIMFSDADWEHFCTMTYDAQEDKWFIHKLEISGTKAEMAEVCLKFVVASSRSSDKNEEIRSAQMSEFDKKSKSPNMKASADILRHAETALRNGVNAKRSGNLDSATEWYLKSISLNPENPIAYYSLAKTCYLIGDDFSASINYFRALHLIVRDKWEKYKAGDSSEYTRIMLNQRADYVASVQEENEIAVFLIDQHNILVHLAHSWVDMDRKNMKARCRDLFGGLSKDIDNGLKSHIINYRASLMGNPVSINQDFEQKFYEPMGFPIAVKNLDWLRINRIKYKEMFPTIESEDVREIYDDNMQMTNLWRYDDLIGT